MGFLFFFASFLFSLLTATATCGSNGKKVAWWPEWLVPVEIIAFVWLILTTASAGSYLQLFPPVTVKIVYWWCSISQWLGSGNIQLPKLKYTPRKYYILHRRSLGLGIYSRCIPSLRGYSETWTASLSKELSQLYRLHLCSLFQEP